MAKSLLLPLRPNGNTRHDGLALESKLRQIDQQKGAFRHVTEQAVLEDIQKADAGVLEIDFKQESEDEDEESQDGRQEMVWKAREKMLKQLDRAKNDTLHALDFVSLLLSKHSAAAQSSMSPFLQQAVSPGSLDGQKMEVAEPTTSSKRRLDVVSKGWKTKSFQAAAAKVLKAGEQLEVEATAESSFWDQVAHVKEQGWAVSRLPRDSRAIAVHFGFAESAPRFRNRGFAVLRRGLDGRLQMDRAQSNSGRAGIQVAVLRKGKEPSYSSSPAMLNSEDLTIDQQIQQARNALFEEELFYETAREGRAIANQGIVVSSNCIKFEIEDDYQVQIELVRPGEYRASNPGQDQALPDLIAWALRVLLSYAHSQSLLRRSKQRPPISNQPTPTSEFAILRPLISRLRHLSIVSALQSWALEVQRSLTAAGMKVSVHSDDSLQDTDFSHLGSDGLLKGFLDIAQSTLRLSLPSGRNMELMIRTRLGPPTYGTVYSMTPLEYEFASLKIQPTSSLVDMKASICHATTVDVLALVESALPPETSGATTSSWKIRNVHGGEIVLEGAKQDLMTVMVRVSEGQLGVRIGDHLAQGAKETRLIWHGDAFSRSPSLTGNRPDQRHLVEIMKTLISDQAAQHSTD